MDNSCQEQHLKVAQIKILFLDKCRMVDLVKWDNQFLKKLKMEYPMKEMEEPMPLMKADKSKIRVELSKVANPKKKTVQNLMEMQINQQLDLLKYRVNRWKCLSNRMLWD